MDIRRIWLCRDVVLAEGGLPALMRVTRVAACAVIANPFSGRPTDDLAELVPFGASLGDLLVKEALALLTRPALAYGKGRSSARRATSSMRRRSCTRGLGKPMRDAIGGGRAIIPSNVKIGGVGAVIDLPLGHKDDVWSFDQIDTLRIMVPSVRRDRGHRGACGRRWAVSARD
jgi:hypothetical protein